METVSLLLLGALVVVGFVATSLFLRSRAAADARLTEVLLAKQNELGGRLSQLAETSAAAQTALNKTLDERLGAVSKRLGESLEKSSNKTAETLGNLKKHLNVIDEAQKNITELTVQVVSLQDILANKQARGAFGEIQLSDLVRNALPPSAYELQATLSNNRRADCLIKLANPPGPIVIDAKFPLESYHGLRDAADDAAKAAAARAFAQDIQKHVKDIAERYIVPGETAESALMFVPSEAVYAEIHGNFTAVVEQSYRARVWIVSPTTLWALLNTVRAVLKDVHMREQASVIQGEVQLMLGDVSRLDDRVENLQRHFAQASEDVRQIRISTEKVTKRGERIEDLQLGDEGPSEEVAGPRLVETDRQTTGD